MLVRSCSNWFSETIEPTKALLAAVTSFVDVKFLRRKIHTQDGPSKTSAFTGHSDQAPARRSDGWRIETAQHAAVAMPLPRSSMYFLTPDIRCC